ELSKMDCAATQLKEIAPLRHARGVLLSIAVNFLDVRVDDAHAGKLPANMRRGHQLFRIEQNVIAGNFNARNLAGLNQAGDAEVETAQRNFQKTHFCNVQPNTVPGNDGDTSLHFDGERDDLVQG